MFKWTDFLLCWLQNSLSSNSRHKLHAVHQHHGVLCAIMLTLWKCSSASELFQQLQISSHDRLHRRERPLNSDQGLTSDVKLTGERGARERVWGSEREDVYKKNKGKKSNKINESSVLGCMTRKVVTLWLKKKQIRLWESRLNNAWKMSWLHETKVIES